jgi:protein import protein ZIM17
VSQQGYHHGSVLITCPGCRNRHLLSDHLDIFSAGGLVSLAEVMGKHGRLVKYGALGDDGKLEFWPDGGKMGDDGGVGISGADVSGRTDREKGAEDGVEKDGANAGLASELDGDEEEEGFDEDDDVEDYIPHPPSRG